MNPWGRKQYVGYAREFEVDIEMEVIFNSPVVLQAIRMGEENLDLFVCRMIVEDAANYHGPWLPSELEEMICHNIAEAYHP